MKILIDTNIIIDVFAVRELFLADSEKILTLCGKSIIGYILASQTTDIFYILQRETKSQEMAINVLKKIIDNIRVLNVTLKDVKFAIASGIKDYEDALIIACAERAKAHYIVTRNVKDFAQSKVKAIEPAEFLALLNK